MKSLAHILQSYHYRSLQAMVNTLMPGLCKTNTRKQELVRRLSEYIPRHVTSRRFIASLSPAERGLLSLVLHAENHTATRHQLLPPMLKSGLILPDDEGVSASLPLEQIIRSLITKGLLVNLSPLSRSTSHRTLNHVTVLGIAEEVARNLPRDLLPLPQPHPLPPPPEDTELDIQYGDPDLPLRQLFFVWASLRSAPARLLKSGGLSKRDLRRIARNLGLTDDDLQLAHVDDLCTTLMTLNLTRRRENTLEARDDEQAMLFWNSALPKQARRLMQVYPKLPATHPPNIIPISRHVYVSSLLTRPLHEMRQNLIDTLHDLSPLHWTHISLIFMLLGANDKGSFLFPPREYEKLHANLSWQYRDNHAAFDRILHSVEWDTLLTFLEELHSLGILDLGYIRDATLPPRRRLRYIRYTSALRADHTGTSSPTPDDWQLVLQPDYQLLAIGAVPLGILASIEWIAERERMGTGLITYRITRQSIYRAFQRGDTVRIILAFLEKNTGRPIPQNVARTIEEWGEQYERIRVRRDVTILQVSHASLLETLLEDDVLRTYLHRLDETTAWLRDKDIPSVERRLRALNYPPSRSRGPDEDLRHSLQWEDDMLRPRRPLPSLYVLHHLRRIADEVEDGWQLTRASIQRATAEGLDADAIAALLERMTGDPLPPAWLKRLKAWGRHYGEAHAARALLLRLEEPHALEELRRADPRLRRHLHPLSHSEGIAVVEEEQWETIRAILEEWGVTIHDMPWW